MIHHNEYFIGWVVGNAKIYNDKICFFIKNHDKDIVSKLYNILINHYNIDLNAIYYNITKSCDFYLQVKSNVLARNMINLLGLTCKTYSKKSCNYYNSCNYYLKNNVMYTYSLYDLPYNEPNYYIRGLFESKGYVYQKNDILYCGLRSYSRNFLENLLYDIQFNLHVIDKTEIWIRFNKKYSTYYFNLTNTDAYNFLHFVYGNNDSLDTNYTLNRKYEIYNKIKDNYFPFYKTNIIAWPPFKSNNVSNEFNLTVVKKIKVVGGVYYYDTCIQLKEDHNMNFYINCNYILKHYGYENVGYIHQTEGCTPSIIIKLIKRDKSRPDLLLPCSIIKMIPKKADTTQNPTKVFRSLY